MQLSKLIFGWTACRISIIFLEKQKVGRRNKGIEIRNLLRDLLFIISALLMRLCNKYLHLENHFMCTYQENAHQYHITTSKLKSRFSPPILLLTKYGRSFRRMYVHFQKQSTNWEHLTLLFIKSRCQVQTMHTIYVNYPNYTFIFPLPHFLRTIFRYANIASSIIGQLRQLISAILAFLNTIFIVL